MSYPLFVQQLERQQKKRELQDSPESKVHGANMGPTWVLSAPDGPDVGPMNLAIRVHSTGPLWGESACDWSLVACPHKGLVMQNGFPCHDVIIFSKKWWCYNCKCCTHKEWSSRWRRTWYDQKWWNSPAKNNAHKNDVFWAKESIDISMGSLS